MIVALFHPREKRGKGFTLVELQVAIVLMTFIALLLAGGLRATVQAWEKSTSHQDTAEHRFMVDQFLRRHFQNMRFYGFALEGRGNYVSFMGERDVLHFVAPFPNHNSEGSLYWWSLKNQWNEKQKRNELILEYMPYASRTPVEYRKGAGIHIEDVEAQQIFVDEGLELVEIDYFLEELNGLDTWKNEWEPGKRNPQFVQITLQENVGDKGSKETFVIGVAPRYASKNLVFLQGDRDG